MGATLRDVAARAGVSASTACRALAGHAHIHPATRAAVIAAATELNYVPNRLARSLVRRQSDLIGYVLFDVANPFFAPVTRGIQDVVQGAGYDLVLSCSNREQQQENNAIDLFERLRADGFLVTPVLSDLERLRRAAQAGAHFVIVGRAAGELGFSSVAADDRYGGALAAEHLLSLGHREIAFVLGGYFGSLAEEQRYQGYQGALKKAGLEPEEGLKVAVGRNDIYGGKLAAQRLLELPQLPRAVIAANDLLAIGVLSELRAAGRRVPEDVALVGFDDIEFCDYVAVPLTTVRLPQYEIGRQAAGMLLDKMRGERPAAAEQLLLQPALTVRKSCGAVQG